jgi:hypothetical protein
MSLTLVSSPLLLLLPSLLLLQPAQLTHPFFRLSIRLVCCRSGGTATPPWRTS